MPELPEVETIRRSLAPVLGRRIVRVRLLRRDIVVTPDDPFGGVSRARSERPARQRKVRDDELLVGAHIRELLRRGKQLAILADTNAANIIQLGMSGRVCLRSCDDSTTPEPHTHILWTLDDGSTLAFIDPRRFGGVRTIPNRADLDRLWSSTLGPDALAIQAPDLRVALARTRRPIKSALLDQRVLAGVGNIYADEALFAARLHPARSAATLSPGEVRTLASSIRETLRQAVEHRGSTLRDYRDASGSPGDYAARHAVYGRAGKPCLVCGQKLCSATLAQRTTVWCNVCQPQVSTVHPHHPRGS